MSDDRRIIRVSIRPESLTELLAGPLVPRFWLRPAPEYGAGVYCLSAAEPDDRGKAALRALFPTVANASATLDLPALPDPDESTAYWMEKVRELLDWPDPPEVEK